MVKLLSDVKNATLKFTVAVMEGFEGRSGFTVKVWSFCLSLLHVCTVRSPFCLVSSARHRSSGLLIVSSMSSTCACHLEQ